MGLPTVLINQFAKSTNDTKNELKIQTLYGRAKIVDGKQYVQLDGSDLLTPCTSSVTLKNDDRVIVSVGRHEAVVTGNLTGPAVNTGDVTGIVDKTIGETVNQSLDAYDIKLKQMNELAANTLGFYYTEEKDENGATISYRHDKPTLADSTIIYKTGIEGFFLSVDGGNTWKAGFDSNGDAVLNILYAIGIQSKWINTRGFTAVDNEGKETFKIDETTGAVYIDPKVFMLGDKEFGETINQVIENGSNIVILLSNESQNVSTDAHGNILGNLNCSTSISVMHGANDITDQCQIGITTLNGISTYDWNTDTKTLTVTGISQDNCYAEFTAIYNDITVKRRFNITKQRAGTNGSDGKGIESITVYYATNNSTSPPPSYEYSTTFQAPTESAKYLWTYQVTRFTDGTMETTTPHVIGTYGRDGGNLSAAEIWELLLSMHKDFIYKGSDGNIYIKATYIDTGNLCGWTADRVNKKLEATNGIYSKVILDAYNGRIKTTNNTTFIILKENGNTESINGTTLEGPFITTGQIQCAMFYCNTSTIKNLSVTGTKSRTMNTKNYGKQSCYCYEMPTPFFGDIGESVIDEDGTCIVDIDDIFQETVSTNVQYYVSLQKYGEGDCWVAERKQTYFVVKGTPGLKFGFEIKARQNNFEHVRFEDLSENDYDNYANTDLAEPTYEEDLYIYNEELPE